MSHRFYRARCYELISSIRFLMDSLDICCMKTFVCEDIWLIHIPRPKNTFIDYPGAAFLVTGNKQQCSDTCDACREAALPGIVQVQIGGGWIPQQFSNEIMKM